MPVLTFVYNVLQGVSDEFNGKDAFLTNTAGTPAFTPPESLAHKPGDDPYSGKVFNIVTRERYIIML